VSAVLFDVLGTVFDLTPLEQKLGGRAQFDAWFERLLHSAATVTATGAFKPFSDLARATLDVEVERLSLELDPGEVLGELESLSPYPDARSALDRLAAADVRAAVLTNGGLEQTHSLLEAAGLSDVVVGVFAAEEVEAYKPDPRPYRHAVKQLGVAADGTTLIAAHGWDVLGARAAGLKAIWVDRLEKRWPFPGRAPTHASDLLEAAVIVTG
jgi:2-haloacid dehalogenase